MTSELNPYLPQVTVTPAERALAVTAPGMGVPGLHDAGAGSTERCVPINGIMYPYDPTDDIADLLGVTGVAGVGANTTITLPALPNNADTRTGGPSFILI